MKRLVALAYAGVLVQFASADEPAVANPDGILEAASTAELQSKIDTAGASGLTLGSGMLKWTGTGESVWSGGYVAAPVSNLSVTVNVTDPAAKLVIAGAVSESKPAFFVKSGPGTVEFRKGGRLGYGNAGNVPWSTNTFWNTYYGMTEGVWAPMEPTWNERGEVKGGTTTFTLVDGTVRLNAPGETFYMGNMPWIGDRAQHSPCLEVTNRTALSIYGGWTSLARGTGLSGNDASPVVRVVDNSSVSMSGLCMGNGNGAGNPYYARARLELEKGGKVTVSGQIFQPEHLGNAMISVKDHSLFNHACGSLVKDGWIMSYSARTVIDGCSTGQTEAVAFANDTGSFTVTDRSVFKFNRGITAKRNAVTSQGVAVRFDASTLMPLSKALSDWFGNAGSGFSNFTVGTNGLTMHTDTLAYFGTVPKAEGAASKIVKTGRGTLHVRPFATVPVELREGTLATAPFRTFTNGVGRTLAPAANTRVEVAGEGALGGMTLTPAGDCGLDFVGRGKTVYREWVCNGYARAFDDGTIQLTVGSVDSAGSAWHKTRQPVDRSFTVTFDYFANSPDGQFANGFMLVFQNKDTQRLGGNAGNQGYNWGTIGTRFEDDGVYSFAMGLEPTTTPNWLYGKGGNGVKQSIGAAQIFGVTGAQVLASETAPCRCVFRYDATVHKATLTVRVPGADRTVTTSRDIDLSAHLAAATAFVGFVGGGSAARICEHCIGNFRFTADASRPDVPSARVYTGGRVALGAGRTLSARLAGNEATRRFAADELTANGAVTLAVDDLRTAPDTPVPPPSSADSNVWTFVQNGHWTAEGPACAKFAENADGGVSTKYAYPVTGSWKIAFDCKTGWNGAHACADWMKINLGNGGTVSDSIDSTGLGYEIRFFDAGKDRFYLWAYKKGAAQTVVGSAAKVDYSGQLSLQKYDTLHVELDYDETARTLKTTFSQNQNGTAVSKSFTMADFDVADVFRGQDRAKLWIWQRVGGLQSKTIVANLSWTGDRMAAATTLTADVRPSLAFDRLSGVTSILKTGTADLELLKPEALSASVTLAEGGLRLSKEPLEPVTVGPNGGWIFSGETGVYTDDAGVKIGTGVSNNKDAANLRHRVRVSGDWRASWKMWNLNGADAISFFVHNDARGNNVCGSDHQAAGYTGIGKGRSLAWFTYTGGNLNRMGTGTTGTGFSDNVSPVDIRAATTAARAIDTTVEYDSTAHTLTVTLVQDGTNRFTKTYTGCDLKSDVGGDYAYLGVGSGGGGVHTYPYYDRFKFEQTDAKDPLAGTKYLSALDVTADTGYLTLDSPLANGAFNVADAVTVAAGKRLRVLAGVPVKLTTASLTLGAGATLVGDAAVTVAPGTIAGAAAELRADGVTLDIPAADIAAEKFTKTTLYLSNGAKVRFLGPGASFRDVYVDGVRQPKGSYSTASWIAADSPYGVTTAHGLAILLR